MGHQVFERIGRKITHSVPVMLFVVVLMMVMPTANADISDKVVLEIQEISYDNGYLVVSVDSNVDGRVFSVTIDGLLSPTVAVGNEVDGSHWILINQEYSEIPHEYVLESIDGIFEPLAFSYPYSVITDIIISGELTPDDGPYHFGYGTNVTVDGPVYLSDGVIMVVSGGLTIPEGAELVIGSGSELSIEGSDPDVDSLVVDGRLIIEGEGDVGGSLHLDGGIARVQGSMDISGNVIVGRSSLISPNGGFVAVGQTGLLLIEGVDEGNEIPSSSIFAMETSGHVDIRHGRMMQIGIMTLLNGSVLDVESQCSPYVDAFVSVGVLQAGIDCFSGTVSNQGDVTINGFLDTSVAFISVQTKMDVLAGAVFGNIDHTTLCIGDSPWMTVYDDTGTGLITLGLFDSIPLENVWFTGVWFDSEGSDVSLSTIGDVDVVFAEVIYDIYNIVVERNDGIGTILIDGIPMESLSDGTYSSRVAAGDHHITVFPDDGYQTIPRIVVNGVEMEGMTFTTTGTPTDDSGITYNITVSGIDRIISDVSEDYIAAISDRHDRVTLVVASLDGAPIPEGVEVDLSFTVLRMVKILGKTIVAPSLEIRSITVTGSDAVFTQTILLDDILSDGVSVIGVDTSMNETDFGYMKLGYGRII